MDARTFGMPDQRDFAALSGDYNPIHVDPLRARRLMFGAPVVHGIHTLLWALDCWAFDVSTRRALTTLRATFFTPVRVGDTVGLVVNKQSEHMTRLFVVCGDDRRVGIEVGWQIDATGQTLDLPDDRFDPAEPRAHDAYQMLAGALPLSLDTALAARLFPRLMSCLPAHQIAALLASTRMVGMECPGLHSIYGQLKLDFPRAVAGDGTAPALVYAVRRVDPRFALLTIAVSAPGIAGTVAAHIRPAPRVQPSFAEVRTLVDPLAFAGQRALVIGGSRGLGEVAAKLLAAGGADVRITYRQGRADAEALVADITATGGRAACSPFDVLNPEVDQTHDLATFDPTHLYYFATPFITTGARATFSHDLFDRFARFYVSGFAASLAAVRGASLLGIFCPSTIFVEAAPDTLREYAIAKAAAEQLCAQIAYAEPTLRIYAPRLPKLATDQTMSLSMAEIAEAAPVLLDHLRTFLDGPVGFSR